MKNNTVFFRQSVLAMIGLVGILAIMSVDKGIWSIVTTILAVILAATAFLQVRRSPPSQPYILIWYMATMNAWMFQRLALHAEHQSTVDILDIAVPVLILCTTLYLWWKIRTGPQNSLQTKL